MAKWSQRTPGYKLGLVLLFVGSVLYLVGFASPYWLEATSNGSGQSFGLWMLCTVQRHVTVCDPISIPNSIDWFRAVQAMQCIGLAGLIVSCLYGASVNFRVPPSTRTGVQVYRSFLEVIAAVGGLCGFIGAMVFVGKVEEVNKSQVPYGWAFGLDLTGCILVFLASFLIFHYNKNSPATPGVVYQAGAQPGGATVLIQGQSCPPSSGAAYVMTPAAAYPAQYAVVNPAYPAQYFVGNPQAGHTYPAQYILGNAYPHGSQEGFSPTADASAPPPAYDTVMGHSAGLPSSSPEGTGKVAE